MHVCCSVLSMFFSLFRNEMERQYLECLQFDINVSSSVYAKYYFELRYLAEAHDLVLPIKLLDKERAVKLEVRVCWLLLL